MVLLDIKQAARSHCKEAIERLAGHMRSKDERVSMLACIANSSVGPEQRSDSAVAHNLRLFPREAEWLERRGQPKRWRCRRLMTMRPPESSRPRHPARKGAWAAFLRGHLLDWRRARPMLLRKSVGPCRP
jgi:hypothetical protein